MDGRDRTDAVRAAPRPARPDPVVNGGGLVRRSLVLLLGASLAAVPTGRDAARATDWRSLAFRPQDFAGRTVRLAPAYCGTGGQEGKNPGLYQCAIGTGALYVESRTVSLSRAARSRMKGCGGLDVWERSPFCRSAVVFAVGRRRPAPDIDAKAPALLFSAETLAIE